MAAIYEAILNGSADQEMDISQIIQLKRERKSKRAKLKEKRKRKKMVLSEKEDNKIEDSSADDEPSDHEVTEGEEESVETEELQPKAKKSKVTGYVKPDVRMLDRERGLQRTATKGVIQLFNAVSKQQKMIESKLKEAGSSEIKKSKVLTSIDKKSFVDMLKGKKGTKAEQEMSPSEPKFKSSFKVPANIDKEEEDSKKWDILRSDFMLGAAMKDWDKTEDTGNSKKR